MAGLDQIRTLKQEIKEQKDEQKRLHQTILEHERTIRVQVKDMEQLMNERDVLGSQLVRRNDEIALLNEKIKILHSTLCRGVVRLFRLKFAKHDERVFCRRNSVRPAASRHQAAED